MVSCGIQERSERTKAALSKGRTNDLLQDSLPQHISSRRRLWLVSLLLLAIASALVACDTGPTVERTPIPTSAPTFTATPIATMPALTSEVGWHTVLTMGDTSGNGTLSVQKSFTASKSYIIFFSCKGTGVAQRQLRAECRNGALFGGARTQRHTNPATSASRRIGDGRRIARWRR